MCYSARDLYLELQVSASSPNSEMLCLMRVFIVVYNPNSEMLCLVFLAGRSFRAVPDLGNALLEVCVSEKGIPETP